MDAERPLRERGQVAVEARQQMFRLQGHACVLVLGGNNEVENSFPWFPTTSQANPSLYAVDFARLFLDTIRPIIEATGTSAKISCICITECSAYWYEFCLCACIYGCSACRGMIDGRSC